MAFCLALAVGAIVVGAIAANSAGDKIDEKLDDFSTTATTAVPGGPSGQADEVDDVKIETCEKDSTTGWGTATIKVTNNSSKASTYVITIKFEDGATSYGTGSAIIDRLDPGQSISQDVSTLKDFPSGTCKVAEVSRTAATAAVPGVPSNQGDEIDDVKIETCEKDSTTGWGTATIKVTNNSSKASTYVITIKFEDGATSYGTGTAIVQNPRAGPDRDDRSLERRRVPRWRVQRRLGGTPRLVLGRTR